MKYTHYIFLFTLLVSGSLQSCTNPTPESPEADPVHAFIVGGGSSHDFDRWFNQEDTATLNAAGFSSTYTDDVTTIQSGLEDADVLVLTNNQPIPDSLTRQAIFDFADSGKGVLLIHPALWYNWGDWPVYNQQLAAGGSRSHGPYGPFEITITQPDHPVVKGLPGSFTLEDELYRFEIDPEGPEVDVLAIGTEPDTGVEFPVIWVVNHPNRNIVGITLGHDGVTHESAPYKALLANSVSYLSQ